MRFLVLGPLEMRYGERTVDLGGRRQRAALAVLLLHPNEVVPADRLIDWLWAGHSPATARAVVHSYVSRLRRALTACQPGGSARQPIVTVAAGYRLDVQPEQVDLSCFEHTVARARATGHKASLSRPGRGSAPRWDCGAGPPWPG